MVQTKEQIKQQRKRYRELNKDKLAEKSKQWGIKNRDRVLKKQSTQRQLTIQRKRELIDYKGGKCQICGLVDECSQVYDFHHLDPNTKEYEIGSVVKGNMAIKYPIKMVKKEVDKCLLLCANCHRRIHASK